MTSRVDQLEAEFHEKNEKINTKTSSKSQHNLKEIKKGHKHLFSEMRGLGVGVNLHYIPIYHHPFYESLGFSRGYCQNAEIYYSRSMSLPIYYDLTEKDQMVVVDALKQVIK